jgi:FixJ family two-component response regulator
MKAGGADFIEKPFDPDILALKIEKAIYVRELENKLNSSD